MKKLIRVAAVTAAFAGFALPGFAAAQTATVTTQGPNSPVHTKVKNNVSNYSNVKNNLKFKASNSQYSTTGNAKVGNNTTVGNVGTGSASVDNATAVAAHVDNSGATNNCGCEGAASEVSADVSTEGPNSPAHVYVSNNVENVVKVTNNVDVSSYNKQSSKSGNASAYNNTTVGDVTTGDASASNSTTVELMVVN